jgi:exosortase D (VPLPA-CTERM-specific)
MVSAWSNNEDYSYGFLIPLASAYLLWEKRASLRDIPLRSSWGMLPLVFFFVLLSLYGILGSSGNVSKPSIPILIILFTGFCFGIETVKRLILPLGFLFFMVPLPPPIEKYFGLYLKAVSTQMGGAFISLCNIPVNVSGNIIDLGVMQLQVVDACNGMRYIFPLLALGTLYAHFFERVLWKRALCVLATIPLGVLFNALRIGITGVLTDWFGPTVAEGFFHDLSGWIVFVFAFVMLFAISRILRMFPSKAGAAGQPVAPKDAPVPSSPANRGNTTPAFLVSAAVLAAVAALSLSTGSMPAVTLDGGIQGFPLRIGAWAGRNEPVDPVIVEMSGAEEAFSGHFMNGSGSEISLYMGYRSTAFLSNENFFHSPTVCIPSAGWVEREVKRKTITNVPYFNDLDVTEMVIEKGGTRQLVYFWFQTKDKATHSKSLNRFHLSLHAIRRDNTHDLFIRPVTPILSSETVDDAEERLDGFVREMMPVLLQFLKENQVSAWVTDQRTMKQTEVVAGQAATATYKEDI